MLTYETLAGQLQIVVCSRARIPSCKHVLTLLPASAKICVYESESEAYGAEFGVDRLLICQDEKASQPAKAAWVQQHVHSMGVIFVDDDVKCCWCLVGRKPRRIDDPASVGRILMGTAWLAYEAGVSCFSYSPTTNPLKFHQFDPLGMDRVAGPVVGIIGRKVLFDEQLPALGDVDLNLTALLQDRWAIQDRRYAFETSEVATGGSSNMRTADKIAESKSMLAKKWGGTGKNWESRISRGGDESVVVTTERKQATK